MSEKYLEDELGYIAWNTYRDAIGGKARNGDVLPTWELMLEDDTKRDIVKAWKQVGAAISEKILCVMNQISRKELTKIYTYDYEQIKQYDKLKREAISKYREELLPMQGFDFRKELAKVNEEKARLAAAENKTFIESASIDFTPTTEEQEKLDQLRQWEEDSAKSDMIIGGPATHDFMRRTYR